jgi:hypothetical protein
MTFTMKKLDVVSFLNLSFKTLKDELKSVYT